MALYWEFKNKVGEVIFEDMVGRERVACLYQGNAFLIMTNEWVETDNEGKEHNMYTLHSFFADEAHAKNCLGLTKGYTNMFNDNGERWKKIRINKAKYTKTGKLVSMLVKAFDELEIELYKEVANDGNKN